MSDSNLIYSKTIENLKLTYNSKNNEERLQAEETLKLLEKEIFLNFNLILRNLSVDPQIDGT